MSTDETTGMTFYRAPLNTGFGALAWYRKWHRAQMPGGPPASVPCGSCTVCCRSYDEIYVGADDAIAPADTTRTDDGRTVLRRQADGACIYLVNERCTIYNRRPTACRSYDCRAVLVLGHVGSNEQAVTRAALEKFGIPRAKEPDDAAFLLAVKLMVLEAVRRAVPPHLALQLEKWREFLPIVHDAGFREALEAAANSPATQEALARIKRAP